MNEDFAGHSGVVLQIVDDQLVLVQQDRLPVPAELQPRPVMYDLFTKRGTPMVKVAQMCSGDRLCIGMTGPYCFFWKPERRCKFCSIGLNAGSDASQKSVEDIVEVAEAAVRDPLLPARHILVGGGTPDGEDMGALLAAQICRALRAKVSVSIYVMITAPLKNKYIDLLREAGADELGMNIEFHSERAWQEYIPGKASVVGKERYLRALEHSVTVFGPVNTRSLIIVGLEPADETLKGVEQLVSMGVMPILSPFRALAGSLLENAEGFDADTNYRIYQESMSIGMRYGVPIGPTCIACQNNTLALPVGFPQYRCY
ncbi:MAG: radical SAM protein [Deltaproteobacteria bacterium]|nr:radical SAM protein [Deltaproteobacteria bacterium]